MFFNYLVLIAAFNTVVLAKSFATLTTHARPASHISRRTVHASKPTSHLTNSTANHPKSTPKPTPSCVLQNEDPDQNINTRYCICDETKTLPLLTLADSSDESSSCHYKAIPTQKNATIHPTTTALGSIQTNSKLCQICSPIGPYADSCTSMSNCFPQTPEATVQVGSSPVHVGTLTGDKLYSSISNAIETICPTVSQTESKTSCATDSVSIDNIDYVSGGFLSKGSLVVKVDSSAYNETSLRDAMIRSAALTAQHSTTGNNCYSQSYTVEELMRLDRRDHPYPVQEKMTMCNAASFAGVQYYSEFWRTAPEPGSTDYIDASWEFETGPMDNFACDFLEELISALGIIQPEFAVGATRLAKAVDAVCEKAMEHVDGSS